MSDLSITTAAEILSLPSEALPSISFGDKSMAMGDAWAWARAIANGEESAQYVEAVVGTLYATADRDGMRRPMRIAG